MRWREGDLFPGETDLGPLLKALEEGLWDQGDVRLFHGPLHDERALGLVVDQVMEWQADETVVLPADPFYTPPRNGHGMEAWRRLTAAAGFRKTGRGFCCHPTDPLLLRSLVGRVAPVLADAARKGQPQLALVLPWGVSMAPEDPARWQAERLLEELSPLLALSQQQVRLCQLSLRGLSKPSALSSLDGMLASVAAQSAPLVILPFTPLPHDLQARAEKAGIRHLHLVGPGEVGLETAWRAHLVRQARAGHEGICSGFGARLCSGSHMLCPYRSPALFAPPVAGLQLAAMRERA
jgi:hypothetical protein